jgi:hypothetical protein
VQVCHYKHNKLGLLERHIGTLYENGHDVETTWRIGSKFYFGLVAMEYTQP